MMRLGRKGRSTQELIGVTGFTRFGLATAKGEMVFYTVSPTNISVLSSANIALKIWRLQLVFQALPDIELVCTDSCECFDANKANVAARLEAETNPMVRAVLESDMAFFDDVQAEMSTARQFMFAIRLKSQKPDQQLQTVNRVEKIISEQGFELRRMERSQLKRALAIYFGASMDGDRMPDFDGEQYVEVIENESEN